MNRRSFFAVLAAAFLPATPKPKMAVTIPSRFIRFGDVKLGPVGIDCDGKIIPIDTLAYDFPPIGPHGAKLAKYTVRRWYRIVVEDGVEA